MLERLVLADLLDDEILGARPGSPHFPLRSFMAELGQALDRDDALALAAGLNFMLRAALDEDEKVLVGFEVGRAYYRFADAIGLEGKEELSPLVAELLSSASERATFESIDHLQTFDSALCERDRGARQTNVRIARPTSFLVRLRANKAIRMKARVLT